MSFIGMTTNWQQRKNKANQVKEIKLRSRNQIIKQYSVFK